MAPVYTPSPERVSRANLTRFMGQVQPGASFAELYRWSVDCPEEFWPAVWDFCGVRGTKGDVVLRGDFPPRGGPGGPPSAEWFPEGRLNFAANLLRYDDDREAIVFWNELGRQRVLTYAELQQEVARWRAALARSGVTEGDPVVGLMPNMPETVICMLAATSLGAIWSGCSPDFGDRAVLDRFGQIQPKVMVTTDGYRYAGKVIDLTERIGRIAAELPSVRSVVMVPYLGRLGGSAARPK